MKYFMRSIDLIKKYVLTHVGLVIYPLSLVIFYLWILAPDRYESQAAILVKDSSAPLVSEGLLQNMMGGGLGVNVDEKILQAFVISADLLIDLDAELNVKEHFQQSNDFIFGIDSDSSLEDFLSFFRKVVAVQRDKASDLLVIKVHAYDPIFAKELSDAILTKSEKFVNELSQSMARQDMVFAQEEIMRNQNELKKTKAALTLFQNKNGLVSPDQEGQSLINIVYELESELAKTQTQIRKNKSYLNDNSPQLLILRDQANALSNEISGIKLRITGVAGESADKKLLSLGEEYQNLILDVDLATSLYTSSLTAYELARAQAIKKIKYLVVASSPQLAEESLYPRRLYWLVTWSIIFFAISFCIRLIRQAVLEHRD